MGLAALHSHPTVVRQRRRSDLRHWLVIVLAAVATFAVALFGLPREARGCAITAFDRPAIEAAEQGQKTSDFRDAFLSFFLEPEA